MTWIKAEHEVAWIVAGCFALLSACLTSWQVFQHARFNAHVGSRRYVIRILLMVPIYAAGSWLGLRFAGIALYFDLLRECYEAFVIYSFYQLLLSTLGGERKLVSLLAKKESVPHVFPFCCLPKWRMHDRFYIKFSQEELQRLQAAVDQRASERAASAQRAAAITESKEASDASAVELGQAGSVSAAVAPAPAAPAAVSTKVPSTYLSPYSRPLHSDFLTHTQLGTLQYCIARPLTALLAFLLSLLDLYGESSFDFETGYPYLAFITNMSQIWAMYCLILFYYAVKEELAPLRPIPKFLCVKAVVFFTFWQSVLLAGLASMGVLTATRYYTQAELVGALQDFIVCLEMLFAALAHHYAFNWRQWHKEEEEYEASSSSAEARAAGRRRMQVLPAILEALNVTDVYVQDVRRVTTKSKGHKLTKELTREEFHERQYASFVAAQEGRPGSAGGSGSAEINPVSALLNEPGDLSAPLNPDGAADSSADAALENGSDLAPLYRAPTAGGNGGAGAVCASPSHASASSSSSSSLSVCMSHDGTSDIVIPAPLLSPGRRFSRVLVVEDRDVVRDVDAQGVVQAATSTLTQQSVLVRPLSPAQAQSELEARPAHRHLHMRRQSFSSGGSGNQSHLLEPPQQQASQPQQQGIVIEEAHAEAVAPPSPSEKKQ